MNIGRIQLAPCSCHNGITSGESTLRRTAGCLNAEILLDNLKRDTCVVYLDQQTGLSTGFADLFLQLIQNGHFLVREGIIIECPQNGLFHDACEVILSSRTGVSEMVEGDDDAAWPLGVQK